MVGVRLQHRLPDVLARHTVLCRLWPRPAVAPLLRTWRDAGRCCCSEHGGARGVPRRHSCSAAASSARPEAPLRRRPPSSDLSSRRLGSPSAASLPQASTGKLKPRYFGPYRVSELINDVAVRLDLPAGARLHDVFHVGLLKKFQGTPPEAPPPLPAVHHGALVPEPARAVRYRLARGVRQVLIH